MQTDDTRVRINPVIAPPPALPASRERDRRTPVPRKPRVPSARRFPAPADIPRIDEYADAPRH